jgi:hypothetical protein
MDKENVVHMHNVVLFRKKNEVMPFAGKWIQLKTIMLSEISQAQNDKYHIFP